MLREPISTLAIWSSIRRHLCTNPTFLFEILAYGPETVLPRLKLGDGLEADELAILNKWVEKQREYLSEQAYLLEFRIQQEILENGTTT